VGDSPRPIAETDTDTAAHAPAATPRRARSKPRSKWPSLSAIIGLGFAVGGFCLGIRSISDNSLFTHIATGRLILDQRSIPTADPYSFTAAGDRWVVQSWLADLLYGVADRIAGGNGVRVLGGLLVGTLLALVWRLTHPARSLAMRLVITSIVTLTGIAFFAPRPLVFGLVLLAASLVIVTEGRDPRWLVPILWLWVNLHGSFPLALVALGCLALGSRLDGDRSIEPWRPVLWAGLGVVLGAINPLGPVLLLFPLDLLGKMDVLSNVVEWQSPNFAVGYARLFLVQVGVAILALVRRPSYRAAVPLVVFTAAAMLGVRNIPIASIVMVPGLALGLAGIGRLDGRERGPASGIVGAVVVAAGVVVASASLARPAYDLETYPMAAIDFLDQRGALGSDQRVVSSDTVGNLLELRFGTEANVFFDDRYDMYPVEIAEDYLVLNRGGEAWQEVLDRHEADYLLWSKPSPLASLVRQSSTWSVAFEDDETIVACRRGTDGCS
jgi:hypothetical protein